MFRPVAGIRSPIRIGGEQDGGYVVPAEVFKADALFSPGVAQNSDFEFEFATRGIPCFLADESVDGPAREHQNFFFIKRFIGPSSRPDFLSMQAWIQDSGLTGDAFALQMDIEGAEWEVLADADWLSRFRFLVIEFHNLEDAWDRERLLLMSSAVKSLTANFDCVLVVPNNFSPMLTHAGLRIPSTIEVTLVRKGDPSIGSQFSADKAQAMVRKNNPRLRDIDLGCISNSCLERGLG